MREKPLILIVDDELDPRLFLYSLLDSEGYDVATCDGPYDALWYVSHHKPNIVIADVRMPSIDGLELLSKIREMAPQTRVILYSAYSTPKLVLETLERGGVDLVSKGVSNEEILRVVRRALEEVTP